MHEHGAYAQLLCDALARRHVAGSVPAWLLHSEACALKLIQRRRQHLHAVVGHRCTAHAACRAAGTLSAAALQPRATLRSVRGRSLSSSVHRGLERLRSRRRWRATVAAAVDAAEEAPRAQRRLAPHVPGAMLGTVRGLGTFAPAGAAHKHSR
jgi:hypothetical protein